MAAQWGGTGIPKSMENKVQYKSSLEHFSQYYQDNNVVVETTAHLFADNGYAKLNNVLTYSPCLKAGDSWIQTILAY